MRRYLLGVLEGAAVDQKDGDAERGTRPTRSVGATAGRLSAPAVLSRCFASPSHTAGSLDQPLTDPKVKPRTTKRCPKNINTIAGIVATIEAAAIWLC